MEVGDYVRYKYENCVYIGKLKFISEVMSGLDETLQLDIDDCMEEILKEDVIKSSPNIIGLFEEHDLVVIEYYSLRYDERVTRLFEVTYRDDRYINLSNAKCEFMLVNGEFNKGDKELEPIIKSIVTKEQFESMEYKIESVIGE